MTHGIYCFQLPYLPMGGAVSLDSAASGFPVAFMTTDSAEISTLGCSTGDNAAVTTYNAAGGSLTDEQFYAIVF